MKLRLTLDAERQLDAIERHIRSENPQAAVRVLREIFEALELLTQYPAIGRPGRREGTRVWVVRGRPYIVVYEASEEYDELVVLSVYHGARNRLS
jgi:toxin ParE1/3/4